jgi:copper chaperone CopZ
MKIITSVILTAVFLIYGCGKNDNKVSESQKNENISSEKSGSKTDEAAVESAEIKLPTIQCGTCKKNITKALKKVDGIEEIDVNVDDKFVKVKYDKSKTSLEKIEGTIVMAGYQANDKPADKTAYDNLDDCCKIGGHK